MSQTNGCILHVLIIRHHIVLFSNDSSLPGEVEQSKFFFFLKSISLYYTILDGGSQQCGYVDLMMVNIQADVDNVQFNMFYRVEIIQAKLKYTKDINHAKLGQIQSHLSTSTLLCGGIEIQVGFWEFPSSQQIVSFINT